MTVKLLDKVIPAGVKGKPAQQAPRRRWWMGVLPGCPRQKLILRGLSFNSRTGDFGGRGGIRGGLVELTEAQVQDVFDALSHKVVRNPGDANAAVLDTRKDSFRPLPDDQPLAEYVFLLPEDRAAEITGVSNWLHADPPSVLAMLKRGDTEDEWRAPEVARERSEADRLREELAKANQQLAELRAQAEQAENPEEEAEPPAANAGARAKQLEAHNKAELAEYAAKSGFGLPKDATKAQMIDAIVKAEQDAGMFEG